MVDKVNLQEASHPDIEPTMPLEPNRTTKMWATLTTRKSTVLLQITTPCHARPTHGNYPCPRSVKQWGGSAHGSAQTTPMPMKLWGPKVHMCISLTLEFEGSLRTLFPNLEAVHLPIEIALVTVFYCTALLFRTIQYQCGGCVDTY